MIVRVQYVIDIYNGADDFSFSGAALFAYWLTLVLLWCVAVLIVAMLGHSLKTIKQYSQGFKQKNPFMLHLMIFMTCLIMLDYGVFSVIQSVIYTSFLQKKYSVQEWTEKDFVAESIKEPIEAICFAILLYTLDIYSQGNQPSTSVSNKLEDKSNTAK